MQHQVLALKWRPHRFSDVVGQTQIVRALSNALEQQQLHHAYLFTGTRGVGKTTIARIFASCLNCEQGISANPCGECSACQEIENGRFPDLYEVDAASRTKVEDTRELLDNVQYAPVKGRYKVYLIDEVHMLSGHSFNALLKTLEEPPPHVIFLLATTEHQKLPATVLSRCLQFHLKAMPSDTIAEHLQKILIAEKINYEQQATWLLAKAAKGSMRDALSLLDQGIAYGNSSVLDDDIKNMLGSIEPKALYGILNGLAQHDADALLHCCQQLAEQASDFSLALADLLSLLHQLTLIQYSAYRPTDPTQTELIELAKQISSEDVQLYYQIGLIGQRDLPYAPTPQSGFEMILLRMLAFTPTAASSTIKKPESSTQQNTPIEKPQDAQSWEKLVSQLTLSGVTLALLKQCAFNKIKNDQIQLHLQQKHTALLANSRIEKINQALSQHFQQKLCVDIQITDQLETDTPETIIQRKQDQQKQLDKQSIMNDKNVQQIMQTFDAKVVKGSITPLTQTE